MKHFSFLLLFLICSFAKAQTSDSAKVVGIHIAVGKSISREEKIKYQLFTEYKDSLFESARVLKLNDSIYEVVVLTTKGTEIRKNLSSAELDQMYYRIDDISKTDKQHADKYACISEEEKKKIRRQEAAGTVGTIFLEILGQVIISTFEIMLTAALTN